MAKLVDSNKKRMSLLSSMLLILVPWMQISKAVMSGVAISVTSLLGVLAAGIGIHLVFLAFNLTATAALQLGKTADNAGEKSPDQCNLDICIPSSEASFGPRRLLLYSDCKDHPVWPHPCCSDRQIPTSM